MHPNFQLLDDFYGAFARRQPDVMASSYASDAHFTDPVFPDLRGEQIGQMWTMLCTRGKDLELTYEVIEADDQGGRARWEAHYTFSATGREVHNIIDATFEFRDGQIVRHIDDFDFWRWSKQALGAPGVLLGWSGFLRSKMRSQASSGLHAFSSKR